MKKIRLLLLGALAVFAVSAVGAVGAGPAAAAACKAEAGTNFALCITTLGASGSLELISTNVNFTDEKSPGTPSVLEVPALGQKVTCTAAESTGTFEPTGSTVKVKSLTIKFKTGCELVGASSACKVTEPITTVPIGGSLALATGTPTVTFKPEAGTLFSTVHVTGSECEQAATIKVQGEQSCISPKVEEDSVNQTLTCLKTGSKLNNGEKESKFELTEVVSLASPYVGDKWSIIEGT